MQKSDDFVKDKRTKLVISKNPEYYHEVKIARARDQRDTEINNRLTELEKQVNLIKELLRNG